MAKVSDSGVLTCPSRDAWAHASDLSQYDEWLTLHDGWRSEVPAPSDLTKVSRCPRWSFKGASPIQLDRREV